MNKILRILLVLLLILLVLFLIIFASISNKSSTSYPVFVITSAQKTTIKVVQSTPIPTPSLTDRDCRRLDFKRLRRPNSSVVTPPIYDFFLFNDELDLLEIRLYELYNYVALFLIVESEVTLSGETKTLHLKENWQKFEKYHKKMRRFEVELDEYPKSQWANEITMRDDGLRLALQNLTEDIILLTSDVDEIPAAHFLNVLTSCELPNPFQPLVLICAYYYYSFEFRRQGGTTEGATVTFLSRNRTNGTISLPGKLLRDERFNFQRMPSSCYHCSWCFNRINLTRSKMNSYSHSELNSPYFQTQKHILERYREGKDLYDRAKEKYIHVENNKEIPELVKVQRERFAYMWNRTKLVNVGFQDVVTDKNRVGTKK